MVLKKISVRKILVPKNFRFNKKLAEIFFHPKQRIRPKKLRWSEKNVVATKFWVGWGGGGALEGLRSGNYRRWNRLYI